MGRGDLTAVQYVLRTGEADPPPRRVYQDWPGMRTPRRMARRASGFCEAPSANSARTSQSVSQSVSGIFAKIKPAGQTTRIRSHPTSLHTRSSNPAHDIWRCNLRVLDQVIRIQSGTEFPGGGSEQEVTSAPMRMQLQGQ